MFSRAGRFCSLFEKDLRLLISPSLVNLNMNIKKEAERAEKAINKALEKVKRGSGEQNQTAKPRDCESC